MVALWVGIGFVAGGMLVGGICCFFRKKTERPVVCPETDKMDITVQDILRLTALSNASDITSLLIEYKIHVRYPEFYEKYQALSKHGQELYFEELIAIFSKGQPEKVRELYEQYSDLSTQDALLLLMSDLGLDNRTMSRVMALTLEALKKRKTRLNAKIRTDLQGDKAEADV